MKIYKNYEDWEKDQEISPVSPEASYAEKAWGAAIASSMANEPSAWIINHPGGVVTLLCGKTIPSIYAQYATPLYTREPKENPWISNAKKH